MNLIDFRMGLAMVLSIMLEITPVVSQVQDDLKLKLDQSVFLKETAGKNPSSAPYLYFPNLNKVHRFEKGDYHHKIQKAEEREDILALDSLLTNFIGQWGIGNFQSDVGYIWKAGQVKELIGDSATAALYYELGLKNQRPWEDHIKLHYDSLKARMNVEWVDLQFYYKILEARRKIDPLIPPKGVMLNMGPKVNSDRPDYAPFMHPSDSVLLFTSRRNEEIVIDPADMKKNEDLYFCKKGFIEGVWSYAEQFNSDINSEYNEGSACLSRDGKTLIFTRCDEPGGLGSCDLYIADFVGDDWINIRNLGPSVNSEDWDSHPSLSPDGNTLYFASNRKNGFGLTDLYVCYRKDRGAWSPAKNLGPMINTAADEITPFFHQVNSTLYFSSSGHLKNLGGYDIYKTRWLGDHWDYPRNVGPLINSAGNEDYFSIDGTGKRLFYAAAKNDLQMARINQDFDIFSFPMPMEARPSSIVTLRGYLIDSASGNPITGIVLIIDKDEGIEIAPKHINPFGYFEFELMSGKNYDIFIQGENFLTIKESLTLEADTTFSLFAQSFETGKPLVFENLEFADDSYELDSQVEPKLNYLVNFLHKYPMFRLEIKGHTDSDGEETYNLDLSRKRANVIRRYILMRGKLDERRVGAHGYGEMRPLVPNDSEENKRMNRRVEFEVWMDPTYDGPMVLPTDEDFLTDDLEEEFYDPEFMEEFDFDWKEEFDDDLEFDDDPEWGKEFDDNFDWREEEDLLEELDTPDKIEPEDP